MNKSNRFHSQSRFSAVALLPVAAALAAGCVANPPRVEQSVAADNPAAWASRIESLPVEVHGTVPGETAAQTIAGVGHGVASEPRAEFASSGLSLYAMPRVIVYIGGTDNPPRDQYCSLQPHADQPVPATNRKLVLRSELCDGPRAVASARITLAQANPTPDTVARGIERIKSDLVRSLVPPQPDLSRYSN